MKEPKMKQYSKTPLEVEKEAIAYLITSQRLYQRLSDQQLADRAGVNRTTVYNAEHQINLPSRYTFSHLLVPLDITPASVLRLLAEYFDAYGYYSFTNEIADAIHRIL